MHEESQKVGSEHLMWMRHSRWMSLAVGAGAAVLVGVADVDMSVCQTGVCMVLEAFMS